MTASKMIVSFAPQILEEINKASSILLHCHPSPDPDSVGSALAMKFALKQLGKEATVIRGDSFIPQAFMHFPGARDILDLSYNDIDVSKYDLFLVLDSGSVDMVSRKKPPVFPSSMRVVVIDHHKSNTGFGHLNLIDPTYPATCEILFDLFREWDIKLDENIASNLFIGIYTDTLFKYSGVTPRTFQVAGELVGYIKDLSDLISQMENSNTAGAIRFQALALSNIDLYCEGRLAISAISYDQLVKSGVLNSEAGTSDISSILRTVVGWDIDVALIEYESGRTKASFRTRDASKYDVSKLAVSLGGGGHRSASGAFMAMSIAEAKALVVMKVKELYNL